GMKAVGRTVFAGRQVEEFELEIVGVLPGGRTEGDLIMAKAIGPRLEHDGIAAGMGGSPIYIDGRLAGALAYGYPFSRDPICGITPMGEMLDVLEDPEAPATLGMDDVPAAVKEPPAVPRPESTSLPQLRTVLAVGGLSDTARRWLQSWADENGLVLAPGG